MVDEVQRAVVGPVQIVKHQHHGQRRTFRKAPYELRGRVEAAGANLARVVQDAAHMHAGREVQPDQVAHEVGVRFAVVVEQGRNAGDEFVAGHRARVTLVDL